MIRRPKQQGGLALGHVPAVRLRLRRVSGKSSHAAVSRLRAASRLAAELQQQGVSGGVLRPARAVSCAEREQIPGQALRGTPELQLSASRSRQALAQLLRPLDVVLVRWATRALRRRPASDAAGNSAMRSSISPSARHASADASSAASTPVRSRHSLERWSHACQSGPEPAGARPGAPVGNRRVNDRALSRENLIVGVPRCLPLRSEGEQFGITLLAQRLCDGLGPTAQVLRSIERPLGAEGQIGHGIGPQLAPDPSLPVRIFGSREGVALKDAPAPQLALHTAVHLLGVEVDPGGHRPARDLPGSVGIGDRAVAVVDTAAGQHVVGGTGLRDLFGEARLQPIDRGRASERCLYLCSDQHSARQHHLGDRRGVLEGLVAAHVVLPARRTSVTRISAVWIAGVASTDILRNHAAAREGIATAFRRGSFR